MRLLGMLVCNEVLILRITRPTEYVILAVYHFDPFNVDYGIASLGHCTSVKGERIVDKPSSREQSLCDSLQHQSPLASGHQSR